jgi:uncharacterized integral membrane protein (TIGR00697 family)
MTLFLVLFWIVVVSLFAVLAAYYTKKSSRPDAVTALYVTLVIFANFTASKAVAFDLGFTTVFAPAAVLIFAVTFLLLDIVNEKFGRAETQRMIVIALFSQIAVSLFSFIIVRSTPAPFFTNQQAIETIFGSVPRIVVASLIAFYISENVDAYLFQWFKKLTHDKHLWMRNVFSGGPAMFLDSAIFITLAFYGTLPILTLIIGQTVVKWIVAIIDIPFMYLSRYVMDKK